MGKNPAGKGRVPLGSTLEVRATGAESTSPPSCPIALRLPWEPVHLPPPYICPALRVYLALRDPTGSLSPDGTSSRQPSLLHPTTTPGWIRCPNDKALCLAHQSCRTPGSQP